MANEYESKRIIDIKQHFKDDICSGTFDNFLFFTYSVDPELIEWFPENSEVAICAREEILSKIRKFKPSKRVTLHVVHNHAKIYLMWNKREIKCWIGSFNFTVGGLSSNIEWAAAFQGRLNQTFYLEDIFDGNIPAQGSDDFIINQVLDFVKNVVRRIDSDVSYRYLNTDLPLVLLNNQGINTLSECISRLVRKAKGHVKITYITPFLNKSGILGLFRKVRSDIRKKRTEFYVLTNMPNESYDLDTFLSSSDIRNLKKEFRIFRLLKRKVRNGGTILPDGTEISTGFMHLKLVLITSNVKGHEENHTIFTSANLTRAAWVIGKNLDIGLLIREPEKNLTIKSFVQQFSECFSEPDSEELKKIDDQLRESAKKKRVKKYWMEDFVQPNLQLRDTKILLRWDHELPEISGVVCKSYYKDLATHCFAEEIVNLKEQKDGFYGRFTLLEERKNLVVDYLEISFKTRFVPPQVKIESDDILACLGEINGERFFRLGDIPERDRDEWNQMIVDGRVCAIGTSDKIPLQKKGRIHKILLRRLEQKAAILKVLIEVSNQPHLKGSFFTNARVQVENIPNLDRLVRINLEVNKNVDPPFDTIQFCDPEGNLVEYIGFSKNNNQIQFYFTRDIPNNTLIAEAGTPYREYFKERTMKIKLPIVSDAPVSDIWGILKKPFSFSVKHKPPDDKLITKLISEGCQVMVSPPNELKLHFKNSQLRYLYREVSGYYRSPKVNRLKNPIEIDRPYVKIAYRGIVQCASENRIVSLMTPERSFFVRKKAITEFRVRDISNIPSELPLSRMGQNDPIAWIVLDVDEIKLTPIEKDFRNHIRKTIRVDAWKNGKKLEKIVLELLLSGTKFCIPVFKKETGTDVCFDLLISFKEDDIVTSNFAWQLWREKYRLRKKGSNVNIEMEDPRRIVPIRNIEQKERLGACVTGSFLSRSYMSRYDACKYKIKRDKIYLRPPDHVMVQLS